ncbi:MAG: WYL domain-containing protein [Clostridia bacterium]|nr:WYL domain-containing protein [Clostridia bacterium]
MPGRPYQKEKLLALREFLRRKTDEEHPAPMAEILAALAEAGYPSERKSVYEDIEILRAFGDDIVKVGSGRQTGYCFASRALELSELKLLVDAVQSSKFITEKKSRQLIAKLAGEASEAESRALSRQVYVSGRVKSMNESILYNVDALHGALQAEKQISFLYFDWDVDKKKAYHRGGERYRVSPWGLVWQDENYYLIAGEEGRGTPRHFRVDKMEQIRVLAEPRVFDAQDFDPARYTNAAFGMFSGDAVPVELRVEDALAGVIMDRFGREPVFRREPDGHFLVTVNVIPSPLFYGWALSFGAGVRIVSPDFVRAACEQQARDAMGDDAGDFCNE